MSDLTIPSLFSNAADSAPDVEAIVFPGDRLTYRELRERVRVFAGSLLSLGVQPGDAVGILMPNCVDNVITLLAVNTIGAMAVPINSRFRARELGHVIADSGMVALVTSDIVAEHVDFAKNLQLAFPELEHAVTDQTPRLAAAPGLANIVMLGHSAHAGMLTERSFLAAGAGVTAEQLDRCLAEVRPRNYAIMLYTSGTTAMPKGCPLKHSQFVSVVENIAQRLGVVSRDRLWDALPMFHASSLLPMLAIFTRQATFISLLHFEAGTALEQMVEERITLAWPAYTTIWLPIMTHADFSPDRFPALRTLLCVGPAQTLALIEKDMPSVTVMSCYGLTECSGLTVMPWHTDPASVRYGTCGKPMQGIQSQIRDPESRQPLPAGQRGSLWMRGQLVIDSYWNDPVKTAESFDDQGWFNTGDLVSKDADGYIYFHGRLRDTLKVGGENVAAVEVEAFLTTHPAVKLAAVVGVPDAKYVEVPAAFIELRPGRTVTDQELIAFCRQGMAGFKVPRYFRYVDEWPMSATKIRKDDLRTPLLESLGLQSA